MIIQSQLIILKREINSKSCSIKINIYLQDQFSFKFYDIQIK